jgi:polynucleotide 5'-hydroxyl-kinase GRC3/NOL9
VIGAPDVGKSTFAQYLYRRLSAELGAVAYLDGDPGQSTLGPPATMTLALGSSGDRTFPPQGRRWQRFVGAVTPQGHMLPVVVGASRLVQAAKEAGAEAIIYDTSGLIDPAHGGTALKLAKIELLQPAVIFAIQQAYELESLLVPLRRSRRVRVVDLRPSPAARRRDITARQTHRVSQFKQYFAAARPLRVDWGRLAVFPGLRFVLNGLVALEDADRFTLGLGVVLENNPRARQVTLYTPLGSLDRVDILRLGDLLLDPQTFRDQRLVFERGNP